jgi:quinol monooxygenase YgiN
MFILKAQFTINAGTREAFFEQMEALLNASLAEDGCLSFGCFEDVVVRNEVIVLAQWTDRTALDQHEASAHVATFKAAAGAMIVSRQETIVYQVSESGPLT